LAGSWPSFEAQETTNPVFIVINIVGDPQKITARRYRARGKMDNWIKEQSPSNSKSTYIKKRLGTWPTRYVANQ
jgi:hypothetical protein